MHDPNHPGSTIMFRKFEEAAKNPSWLFERRPWEKKWYFFYGELMDPSTLGSIINPSQSETPPQPLPQLHPASVQGYKLKLWGDYPALIDNIGPDWHVPIHGAAYEVQSEDEENRLVEHATPMYYGEGGCTLTFGNGETTYRARLFQWVADRSLLQDGSFDLGDWVRSGKRQL